MLVKSQVSSEDILSGNINSLLMVLSIPTAIALSLNAIFNFVDRFYIAGIGELPFAALGMAFIAQSLITTFAAGIGSGVTNCLANAIGSKDMINANYIAYCAVLVTIVASIIVPVVGISTLGWQISLMGISDQIAVYYKSYLTIIYLGAFSIFAPIIFNSILRAEGNMTIPMHVMVIGALLNLVLDPILIFGVSFIPSMGVEGAALATVLARLVASFWAIRCVSVHSTKITVFDSLLRSLSIPIFEPKFWLALKRTIQIGTPITVSGVIGPLVLGAYYGLLTDYGDESKIVLTMGITYLMLVMFPISAIGRSVSTVCAQNFGANQYRRCRDIYKHAALIAIALSLSFSILFVLFDNFFAGFFLNSENMSINVNFAQICFALSFPFSALSTIQMSYLISQGLGVRAFSISLFTIVSLLITFVLQIYHGEKGIWVGYLTASIISVLLGSVYIFIYNRKFWYQDKEDLK